MLGMAKAIVLGLASNSPIGCSGTLISRSTASSHGRYLVADFQPG
jgi:hypothetical protein